MARQASVAGWHHLDHEADMGIEGTGRSAAEAFEQVALGMTAVVTDAKVKTKQAVAVSCRAPDLELLLVDWLNALIYEMATRGMLFGAFSVAIDGDRLEGEARGEQVDRARHQPAVEVKGATLTGVEVHQNAAGIWHARCVVDV